MEHGTSPPAGTRRIWFFATLALLFLALLAGFDFLRFPIRADELHFWPASVGLFQNGLPTLTQLRTYNELSTPLPFLIFGGLEYVFHGGIIVGRAINMATSFAVLVIIGAAGKFSLRAFLCAAGLLLFPYFALVGTHLYTDPLAVLCTVAGVALYQRGRPWGSAVCFIFGIACRQYIVAFPLALLARGVLLRARFEQIAARSGLIAPAIAALSLGGWYAFFDGFAPQTALQAQNLTTAHFYPEHGLYFLSCIGLDFVVVECILFRSVAPLRAPRPEAIVIAAAVAVLFLFFSPIQNINPPVPTMGYLDIAARSVLPTPARVILFWALAMLAVLRFRPLSPAGLMLYANAALLACAHVAWDKYALPMLATLWLLKSADRLDEAEPAPAPLHL
ncbi:MAG TPA: hypothetical protein VGG11_11915 [Xanthobacteraceae bacterium]